MKVHQLGFKLIIFMLGLVAIDLITKSLYLILLYLAGVIYILLRQPVRVTANDCITSPVTGIVSAVYCSKDNTLQCLEILTYPLIYTQSFRLLSTQNPESGKIIDQSYTLNYSSGISVQHVPRLGLMDIVLSDFTNALGSNSVYGHSFFGGKTQIKFPAGFETHLVKGQKVIDGETIIAEEVKI
jgi:hypothetical protein